MPSLGRRLARMMWWQDVAGYAAALLILSSSSSFGLSWASRSSGEVGPASAVFGIGSLVAAFTAWAAGVAVAVCWAVVLWHVFQTGCVAFGAWSGLVYALLGLVLSPWPGMYVIPHMVRLDVKRLLGVEPDDAPVEYAEPDAVADRGGEG